MSVCQHESDHFFEGGACVHCGLEETSLVKRAAEVPLPSVGRIVHYYSGENGVVHYYGWRTNYEGEIPPTREEYLRYRAAFPRGDFGPFAALVVDVGPGPRTVTLKITDRQGRDHVRANVEYGDPGWMWPPRV